MPGTQWVFDKYLLKKWKWVRLEPRVTESPYWFFPNLLSDQAACKAIKKYVKNTVSAGPALQPVSGELKLSTPAATVSCAWCLVDTLDQERAWISCVPHSQRHLCLLFLGVLTPFLGTTCPTLHWVDFCTTPLPPDYWQPLSPAWRPTKSAFFQACGHKPRG